MRLNEAKCLNKCEFASHGILGAQFLVKGSKSLVLIPWSSRFLLLGSWSWSVVVALAWYLVLGSPSWVLGPWSSSVHGSWSLVLAAALSPDATGKPWSA